MKSLAQQIEDRIFEHTRSNEERTLEHLIDEAEAYIYQLRELHEQMRQARNFHFDYDMEHVCTEIGRYLMQKDEETLAAIISRREFGQFLDRELYREYLGVTDEPEPDSSPFAVLKKMGIEPDATAEMTPDELGAFYGDDEPDFDDDEDDSYKSPDCVPFAIVPDIKAPPKKKKGKGCALVSTALAVLSLCAAMVFSSSQSAWTAAANAAEPETANTFQMDETSVVSNDAFEVLLDRYGDVIGWSRKPDPIETGAVQLPSRSMKTDDKGNTVIEIEDPDSMIYDQKLMEVERMPELRKIDESAMQLAKAYDSAESAPRPYMQNNGRINFYFGTMNPRLVCRPLRLTDIELEPGEQIKNLHISDTARWSVSTAWSGGLDALVTHVVVKPQLPDIAANLLIHTNVRTYSIELVSITESQYMPFVGFIYPEIPQQTRTEDEEAWQKLLEQYNLANNLKSANAERERINNARLADPAEINLNYSIKVTQGNKKVAWKPTQAYDAGGKTYIVMPDITKITEAPTFFIKANGREKLANYRVDGNKYIVDRIFDIGILQIGKDRVAIYRKK